MKNILIGVTGLSPQVITETLYALSVQNKIEIHEIIIVTTEKGKKLIEGKIAYKVKDKNVFIKLSDKIKELALIYNFNSPNFTVKNTIAAQEENFKLKDIRSDEHNELFPNKLCEIIKEKSTDPNNTLYCSVSGGRKTMSIFMGFALSLYGRNQDKLYHVLTTEANEKNRLFFFPPNKERDSEIELSEIPFVKLRGVFVSSENKNDLDNLKFSEIVEMTQHKLDNVFEDYLRINVSSGNIFYKKNKKPFGHLSPNQMKFYLNLLDKLKRNQSVPMIELVNGDASKIANANSTRVKINNAIKKALSNDPILFKEFEIVKKGSRKYEINSSGFNPNNPEIITTDSKGQTRLNPGLAKYGMIADIKNIKIEYD